MQNATTGTISGGFANVILFDISGGPGGVPVIQQTSATNYGTGCGPTATRGFGEYWTQATQSLDLGGGITLTPDVAFAPTRYTVSAGAGAFVAPTNGPLVPSSVDDGITGALDFSASFLFPHAGGTTGIVRAATNGYLVLADTTTTGADNSATLPDLDGSGTGTHNGLPRICPIWYDFHVGRNTTTNPASGIYFDVDTVNNKALVTWLDIGDFQTAAAGAASFNFQVELSADGTMEIRYGAMSLMTEDSTIFGQKVVGYSPGEVGLISSTDLSVAMPFLTGAADLAPLVLTSTLPKLGTTATLTTQFVPPPGVLINVLSLTQVNPGVDLGFLGMPGCNVYLDAASPIQTAFVFASGTVPVNVSIPFDLVLAGLPLYSQSLAAAPGYNAFGGAVSNGVAWVLGTVQ
jgi:hypothetical protein